MAVPIKFEALLLRLVVKDLPFHAPRLWPTRAAAKTALANHLRHIVPAEVLASKLKETNDDEERAYVWACQQKVSYALGCGLTSSQVATLDSTPGWTWECQDLDEALDAVVLWALD